MPMICVHNGRVLVTTKWKLTMFDTKALYNHGYEWHWSRSTAPLFMNHTSEASTDKKKQSVIAAPPAAVNGTSSARGTKAHH